jgi:hypothetical protein
MNLDVDFLIDFFNKHSGGEYKDEFVEQDAGTTTTAPSGTGDIIRIIGYSIDGTNEIIYFSPDNSWVEI